MKINDILTKTRTIDLTGKKLIQAEKNMAALGEQIQRLACAALAERSYLFDECPRFGKPLHYQLRAKNCFNVTSSMIVTDNIYMGACLLQL